MSGCFFLKHGVGIYYISFVLSEGTIVCLCVFCQYFVGYFNDQNTPLVTPLLYTVVQ